MPEGIEKESLPGFNLWHGAAKNVDGELHEIMGHIGQLIIKYGYHDGREGEWEARGKRLPRYRYSITHNARELSDMLKQYREMMKKFITAHTNIIKSRQEKEQAIAKDLWNQA